MSERDCCPAVTTTGEWLACALKMPPMPLPTPGAVWRLTHVGRPLACANPSAMPTATISCSPRMKRKSSGYWLSIGSSVDPGLPKIVVMPRSRSMSKVASRTVVMRGTLLGRELVAERDAGAPLHGLVVCRAAVAQDRVAGHRDAVDLARRVEDEHVVAL